MIHTRLLDLIPGLEAPIVQGGMQWVGTPQLVAAVSNAGALGLLTALTQPDPEALRKAIEETRRMTDRPFGVNLTILPTLKPPPYLEYAGVIVDSGVKYVETAGNLLKDVTKLFKDNGVMVIHKCTSIRHAQSAERAGVDVISVDSWACAGHPGALELDSFVLLAKAAKVLKVPFIASGGVAKGLAMALAAGAVGVSMGTRFNATVESPIHQAIKEEMVRANETDTVHILKSFNNTARVHKNAVAKQVVEIERRPGGAQFSDVASLVSGARGRRVYETGDVDAGIWTMGISAGLVEDIPTCQALVQRMVQEAEAVISAMQTVVVPSSSVSGRTSTAARL